MFNDSLAKQLQSAVSKGQIKPKYFDGYKQWKDKFDYFYNITKDVNQTLNIMYGPNGGVNSYQGSLYVNSSLKVKEAAMQSKPIKKTYKNYKTIQKPSGALKFIKPKQNGGIK